MEPIFVVFTLHAKTGGVLVPACAVLHPSPPGDVNTSVEAASPPDTITDGWNALSDTREGGARTERE